MDYFIAIICPSVFAIPLVVALIFSVINHLNKKKLAERVLQSEEKRQGYIRINSMLISVYKKILWQMVILVPITAFALYLFVPNQFDILLPLFVESALFYIIMLDDYFYRKSFLKAIERKTES
ncbi:MAG: hypothetical protein HY867_19465 [Chloroflexi bacterium]|nr:hypothetical protein [Chloroflexota bacterium]